MSRADTCAVIKEVGVPFDTVGTIGGYHGRAVGQTFYAEETRISAFTVWRIWSQDTTFASIHLYIVEVDSVTRKPRPDRVAATWPVSLNRFGDGIHNIEYRFEFDPPIELARRDTFALFLVSDPCHGWFDVFAQYDQYPGGSLWRSWPSAEYFPCGLRPNPEHYPEFDLCFKMEFCDVVTPTRRETWGQLKIRYK